jgi:hypothetical protein
MKQNKTVQSDILARLSTTAGQVFGNVAFEKTQVSRLLQKTGLPDGIFSNQKY